MATEPTYTVRPATVDDVPAMVDVWYHAFNSPKTFLQFPNTPAGGAWIAEGLSRGIREKPYPTHVVVVKDDPAAKTKTVVALARYVIHEGGSHIPGWRERWVEKLVPGMNEDWLGPQFFEPMEHQHTVAMENRPHIFLEMLATHEDHRGLSLGSKLLDWGNEEADRRGWECYLDATLKAVSLYERHGYVAQPFQAKGTPSIPMVRPAKKQES
ncbi:Acyl- N-acyltransferase protein [Rutstroemia sp. NJR-2017a BBW]|nr:Acyl- N-acyltransferase protein [Rutstroemia sp. NJR-2017a BBW]